MITDRKKIFKIANKFAKLCEKNNIWYSLDGLTLLGAKRHGGLLPWHERFDVFVTVEGYQSLKRLFPNNIIDSHESKDYKTFSLVFVDDKKAWNKESAFIHIRVAVPTTIEKLKNFNSFKRVVKNKLRFKRDNIRLAIDDLYEPKKFEGYYVLGKKSRAVSLNWIQVLSKRQKKMNVAGFDFNVLSENEKLLKIWFGDDYMNNIVIPKSWKKYPNPIDVVKES